MSAKSRYQKAAMAPPPVPAAQAAILEPEVKELSRTLMQAVVKTGQIYAFYIDSKKLGIQTNAVSPPQSLASGLGHEVERYDQLCDSIQFSLKRSIAVLQRDLHRREQQLKDIQLASVSASAAQTSPPKSIQEEGLASSATITQPESSPTQLASSSLLGRRPSAISMTSLNRSAFPLKLDLSSAALHSTSEAAGLFPSGLASPVTLAPKSARPLDSNEISEEFMAALSNNDHDIPVDIDLTLSESEPIPSHVTAASSKGLGSSANEPIELDMEMDLFGDAVSEGGMEGVFTPVDTNPPPEKSSNNVSGNRIKTELDLQLLAGLSEKSTIENADLFGNLSEDNQVGASFSAGLHQEISTHESQFDFDNLPPGFDFSAGSMDLFPIYGITGQAENSGNGNLGAS